jgi:two-component system, NtrC family, nitrogen regulation sensor histidine kinase NtrY
MKLRTKLLFVFMAVIIGCVAILAWSVDRFERRQFELAQGQQSDTLVTQFRREFTHRGDEVVYALQGIAEAEGTLRMAIDLSRAQADPSLYARDARGIATSRQLDFLEFVSDDGTLISSAQWPGRIGFKNDWVTQQSDWNQQGAFLAKVELPDKVDLGLLAVRLVNVGEKKFYLIGGRRLDSDFLQALVVPEGMRVLFYRNLEAAFVPGALLDSKGPAEQPDRFAALIETMQKQPSPREFDVRGAASVTSAEKFMTLPLTGRSNELLATVLVGSAQDSLLRSSDYIRNAAVAIGLAGILFALIFSWLISAQISGPLERLEGAAREVAAGRWNAKAETRARGEAGRAARAFNEMTAQLSAKRERLIQAERVAAWRELARNFAVELKLPLFSLQVTLESLARTREQNPEHFDEIFFDSMKTADAELENLKGIIARFGEFARTREPRMQAVDMNEVVRAAVKSFEPQFNERGRPPVRPELLLDEYAAKIWADPEALHKGLENVMANSLNAMPLGGTLTIRTAQQNGAVCVEISDAGSGLKAEESNGPAALPYAAKLQGTGLGLATIQAVVSDHGGRISVESTPGAGTAFRMEFPVAAAPPVGVPKPIVSAPNLESAPKPPNSHTEAAAKQQPDNSQKRKPSFARMIDI